MTAVDSGIRALQFLGLDEEESPVDFDVSGSSDIVCSCWGAHLSAKF